MKKYKLRIMLYIIVLFGIFGILSLSCFSTLEKIHENRKTKEELESKYNTLVDQEENLENEVVRLQDPEYVAKYAREKYLYTKEGELIIDLDND